MTEVPAQVLVVDDDDAVLRAVARSIERAGHGVITASTGPEALVRLEERQFDLLVSDINMPGMSGLELLLAARRHDLDLPVVIMTGNPDVPTAARAVEYGALRYLVKPITPSLLLPIVAYAVQIGRMARVKREALLMLGDAEQFVGDRAALETHFGRALAGMWIAYQPIVRWPGLEVFGHEALLRSAEPTLLNPVAVIRGAESLGRLHELGQAVRDAVAGAAEQLSTGRLFVNLHPLDLADPHLYAADSPLSTIASRVVLEITERASLEGIADLSACLERLRQMGFQIALDDLGAGYSGLTSLTRLEPEFVKLDMAMVRDVDRDATKEKLLGTMHRLARELGMLVIVEGIETIAERDTVVGLGCDLFQGYLFGRPARLLAPRPS